MRHRVGPEQDAVLPALEEPARRPRLTPELPDPCAKFHAHVGEAFEPLADHSQVLRIVPDVQRDERGLRMPCEDTVARFQQGAETREPGTRERPVGMIRQFLVAFVEPVGREEERFGIRNVNGDRQPVPAAGLPHRVEPLVVDGHQRPRRPPVTQVEPQCLEHLQAAGSGTGGRPDLIPLEGSVARFRGTAPGGFGEGDEAAGVRTVVPGYCFCKPLPRSPRQVHHCLHAAAIHDRQELFRRRGIPHPSLPGEGQVGVHVDHRKTRFVDSRFLDVQHAAGLELDERKRGPGSGRLRGLRRRGRRGTSTRLPSGGNAGKSHPHAGQPFPSVHLPLQRPPTRADRRK